MLECADHTGWVYRITRNENDIQDLWKKTEDLDKQREESVRRIHARIDNMVHWVIAGMGGLLLQSAIFILNSFK